MSRRTAGAAVAGATALAAALMFLVVPAVASSGGPSPDREQTVVPAQVERFVVRNDAGQVVARGATAWLPGHRPAATRTMTHQPTVRAATARRGHGVVVRHQTTGTSAPATATR